MPPSPSPDLKRKAQALLQAVMEGDSNKALDFFFPLGPFESLKESRDPKRYWKILLRAYDDDVKELNRKRRGWARVTFESIELEREPTWVPPGDEHNKIGYFKATGAKLTYKIKDERHSIDIHTMITWQGNWYITHLLPTN